MTTLANTGPVSPLATRALQIVGDVQKRALDPVDRFSEIIFGLIMVLTFTGAMSVAESGREDVRQMLVTALACNVAWGLVDGVMYLVTTVAGRARRALVLHGIQTGDLATARAIVLATVPPELVADTDLPAVDQLVARIRSHPEPKRSAVITLADLRGAGASCLLIVLATFPPTIPFLLVAEPARALRLSNLVAVACLFLAGSWLGKATGLRPWLLGLAMVVLGTGLVGLTIALGG